MIHFENRKETKGSTVDSAQHRIKPITAEEVRSIRVRYKYDPSTGEVQKAIFEEQYPDWEVGCDGEEYLPPPEFVVVGHTPLPAKTNKSGYLCGGEIRGRHFLRHMLAWALHHGEKDAGLVIDHINGDRSDNRAINLRAVTPRENAQNTSTTRKSTTGVTGVTRTLTGRYQASIRYDVDGKRTRVNLGVFDSIPKAQEAYLSAKRKLHAGFAK